MRKRGMHAAERAAARKNIFIAGTKVRIVSAWTDDEDLIANRTHCHQSMIQQCPAIERESGFVHSHTGAFAASENKTCKPVPPHCAYCSQKRARMQSNDLQPNDATCAVNLKHGLGLDYGISIQARNSDKDFFIHHAGVFGFL